MNRKNQDIFNLPNFITFLRLILTFFIFYFIYLNRFSITSIIFLAAVLLDKVDGILARNFNQATATGYYFDIFADFILLAGIFILFGFKRYFSFYFLFIIILPRITAGFLALKHFYKKNIGLHSVYQKIDIFLAYLVGFALLFNFHYIFLMYVFFSVSCINLIADIKKTYEHV